MCQFSNELKLAKDDIPIYKVVLKGRYGIESPFVHTPLKFGLNEAGGSPDNLEQEISRIEEGFIHVFKYQYEARFYAEHKTSGGVLVKGYIPRGTYYYDGVTTDLYYMKGLGDVGKYALEYYQTIAARKVVLTDYAE